MMMVVMITRDDDVTDDGGDVVLQLPYTVSVDVNNREALPAPQLNVSRAGHVPTAVETWSVLLPCSGDVAAEVDVVLRVNVTLHRDNVTALTFRRRKICLKGEYRCIDDLRVLNKSCRWPDA